MSFFHSFYLRRGDKRKARHLPSATQDFSGAMGDSRVIQAIHEFKA
jgi:hypothetical protein